MSKEKLLTMKVKELRDEAKKLNISGRWDMTKNELVEAILRAEVISESAEENSAKDEYEDANHSSTSEASGESEKILPEVRKSNTMQVSEKSMLKMQK